MSKNPTVVFVEPKKAAIEDRADTQAGSGANANQGAADT